LIRRRVRHNASAPLHIDDISPRARRPTLAAPSIAGSTAAAPFTARVDVDRGVSPWTVGEPSPELGFSVAARAGTGSPRNTAQIP